MTMELITLTCLSGACMVVATLIGIAARNSKKVGGIVFWNLGNYGGSFYRRARIRD